MPSFFNFSIFCSASLFIFFISFFNVCALGFLVTLVFCAFNVSVFFFIVSFFGIGSIDSIGSIGSIGVGICGSIGICVGIGVGVGIGGSIGSIGGSIINVLFCGGSIGCSCIGSGIL